MTTLWILLRLLHFVAVMALTGSAFYTALLAPARYRQALAATLHPLMLFSSWLALLSALVMLAAQNVLMSGDWHNLSDTTVWLAVLNTRFGAVWQWEIGFALGAVVAWQLTGRLRQQALLVFALLQLFCLAFTGHAAMHTGVSGLLQQSNHALHLITSSFWAGGLVPLLLLMQEARQIERRTDAIRTMMRFSRYGHLAVALALLTGLINSMLIAGWPLTWRDNFYIRLLLWKVILVALMVLVALFNRYWLVPRFRLAGSGTQQKFIRMTQLELLLACGVVGLVSVLATLSPA
ncbi:copper homeostasis membrane protein CopD [Pantoea sp. LMR881]|uniref:copper homeostasis membrane protein CopD n=1 Tax=Pantoea sp. LMR881 TaxID=3014336 RepID=UPI0022AEC8A9|nr:copper homeostasis membrane protein CopD [Pantoea sp. LMR881]MCZ4058261.1 copper homeostasis membrane protein CopD [Pantoea sp. LMR881]